MRRGSFNLDCYPVWVEYLTVRCRDFSLNLSLKKIINVAKPPDENLS